MRITVSGHIGSGKTTVSKILSDLTSYDVYSGGYFFRQMSEDMHVSLEEMNLMAEKDSRTDVTLNNMIRDFLRDHDDIIVESRLAGWISYSAGIPAFRVFLDASREVRIARVSIRENDRNMAEKVVMWEESENFRFKEYFGFSMEDKSIYDVVIDTEKGSADEIANEIYRMVFSNA